MKPNPDDILELYLGSLKALGIDPLVHDLRFVEDNWESPTLGAWGLGWEVWLNGMEVTQFTYFQQAGGLECRPVTGEITYGLERLCMYLQNVDNVYDLVWTVGPQGTVTYGDVYHQNEVEQSTYNFEHADVGELFHRFDACEAEALQAGRTRPAAAGLRTGLQGQPLASTCSTRAARSRVTERQRYILRVRTLSRRWPRRISPSARSSVSRACRTRTWQMPEMKSLLIELGTEELPPKALPELGAGLLRRHLRRPGEARRGLRAAQRARRLYSPRRLARAVSGASRAQQPDAEHRALGPYLNIGLNAEGQPTQALLGFAAKNGVDVAAAGQAHRPTRASGSCIAHPKPRRADGRACCRRSSTRR